MNNGGFITEAAYKLDMQKQVQSRNIRGSVSYGKIGSLLKL